MSRVAASSDAPLRDWLSGWPEAMLVIRDDRISFANPAAQRLFGADEALLRERAPPDPIDAGFIAQAQARVAAQRAGAPVVPMAECEIRQADGLSRIVEATVMPVDAGAAMLVAMRDVTDFRRAQRELFQSNAELQNLVAVLDRIQDDERRRIARELHDDLQQTMSAIRMDLSAVGERLAGDRAGAAALLARIDALAAAAVVSTRRIVADLRPPMLDELGLLSALRAMASQFGERTGVACHVEADDSAVERAQPSPAASACLYRVAQEALNNVLKHAGASRVDIRLAPLDNGFIELRIGDDGRGMSGADRHRTGSVGLLGMAERVRVVGGRLGIDSPPGGGTTVEARVPVDGRPAAWRVGSMSNPPAGMPPSPAMAAGAPVQRVIDALAEHVAMLDLQGVITRVNRAWREFAERNGDPGLRGCGPGVDYLAVCRRAALTEPSALGVLQGLQAVVDGRQPVYSTDYPCHAPDELRWFRMHAAPMADGQILVTHFELSARRLLRARDRTAD